MIPAPGPGGERKALTAATIEGVRSSFAAAVDASGGATIARYSLGGGSVCLNFASRPLADRLTPAFAHRLAAAGDGSETALSIDLWDSGSTGAPPPPLPRVPADTATGALFHLHEPPLRAAFQPALGSFSILDSAAHVAWHWVDDAGALPYWDEASPLRQILFWWLASRGYLQVHGAAVGTPRGGVLVVGRAGSGKSTVALSTLGSDLLYAGDDYVAVTLDPAPRVESLYNSGKLEPPHVERFLPHLVPLLANRERLDDEKAVVYVHEHFPRQTTAGFPLRAVLVPRIEASQPESRVVETSRFDALFALAPSTMFQLHTADRDALAVMSRLVELVPCFQLELGSDPAGIPRAIAAFLDRLPAR